MKYLKQLDVDVEGACTNEIHRSSMLRWRSASLYLSQSQVEWAMADNIVKTSEI